MHADDALILNALRNGDDEAFEHLVQKYSSSVFNFLYHLIGSLDDAEDLTQEVFVKVWKFRATFDSHKSFKTWLFSIARHAAIDYLRKKKPISFSSLRREDDEQSFEEHLEDLEPLPDELFAQKELKAKVTEALSELSADAQAIVLLHHQEDLTFAEIGEILGKSLNTVKSQYHRAMLKLREKLLT